jgi:protein-tyrosine phosphatase
MSEQTRRIIFVCHGNICRSPMAERIAEKWAANAGLANVTFTSAGVSSEEEGNPIDRRARALLEKAGYRSAGHRAHKITAAEIETAELVIAMEASHVTRMRRIAPQAHNFALLTDFDPDHIGEDIADPWYGYESWFVATQHSIESAMPGLIEHLLTSSTAR